MPFLAIEARQFPKREWGCDAVEATVFDRIVFEPDKWHLLWETIAKAIEIYTPQCVTFHFPVNDSDYVEDTFVRARLAEAIARSSDAGLHGLVVHSNRIRPIPTWSALSLVDERHRVIDCLDNLLSPHRVRPPLFIENMPVMDNFGKEIDPLFVYPDDFSAAIEADIGIVWDFCHFTNTVASVGDVEAARQSPIHYPHLQPCDFLDFIRIGSYIRHWHFSAFAGIANPDTGARCIEGIHPEESTLGPEPYVLSLKAARDLIGPDTHVVLELREDDYENRRNFNRVKSWLVSQC